LFPWKTTWSVKEILPTLIEGAIEADRAAEARQHALEWAYRNKGLFCGPSEEPKTPPGGWIGRWDIAWIGFFKNRLIEELSRAGYDSRSAIRQWYERGLLVCSDGRKTLQVRADGNMVRMIAIVPGEIDQFTKKPELTSETTHTGPDSTTQFTKIHSLTGQQHIPLHTKENTTALHDQHSDSTRICYGTGETGYIGELDVVDDDDKDVPF
jgi:hypothetical protein